MIEDRVSFLCNIALNLSPKNDTHKILRSYYLMRCNEVSKGYGLPPKYFSTKARCPHCYSDWTRDSYVKVQPLKLTKRQRKRIKSQKKSDQVKNNVEEQKHIHQNEMMQVCSFCKQSNTTHLIKPEKLYKSTIKEQYDSKANRQTTQEQKKVLSKLETNKTLNTPKPGMKDNVINLYTKAFDVFSLKNDKNTLSSTIKEPPKVIKNNKKRKDKFAGLCQKAVMASAKLKEQKGKETNQQPQNKLNLFLKPSSG